MFSLVILTGSFFYWTQHISVSAQSLVWGQESEVTDPGREPHYPASAVAPDGQFHLIWNQLDGALMYKRGQIVLAGPSSQVATTVEGSYVLSDIKPTHGTFSIAVDDFGNPHVAFTDLDHKQLIYMYSPNGGSQGSWITEIIDDSFEFILWFSIDIEVNDSGVPYITFTDYPEDFDSAAYLTFKVNSGAWAEPIVISPDDIRFPNRNELAVTGFGEDTKVYVTYSVFENQSSKRTAYLVQGFPGSLDNPGSMTWTRLDSVINTFGFDGNSTPEIQVDRISNQIYLTVIAQLGDEFTDGYATALIMSMDGGNNWSQPLLFVQNNIWSRDLTLAPFQNKLYMGVDLVEYTNGFGPNYIRFNSFNSISWREGGWQNPGTLNVSDDDGHVSVGGPAIFISSNFSGGIHYNATYLDRFIGPIR